MKRLAILPARGGSKRIPNKNIKDFFGKPMISHILSTAESTNLFDKIHVSTDSKIIYNVVSELGFTPDFFRPKALASDTTPIMPVLKFVLKEYKKIGYTFDQVWSILPCSPLISSSDFLDAEKLYLKSGNKQPVMTVSEYPVPIEWAFDLDESSNLKPVQAGKFSINSQNLKKRYFDTGNFTIFPEDLIENSPQSGFDDRYIGFILRKDKAIDIDTDEDWSFAESLFYLSLNKNNDI